MPWTKTYIFGGDFEDRRGSEVAELFAEELERELSPGHPLHGRTWMVVARALPQDEVIAQAGDEVALIHLTWTRRAERLPWPESTPIGSATEFESVVQNRY